MTTITIMTTKVKRQKDTTFMFSPRRNFRSHWAITLLTPRWWWIQLWKR